MSSRLYDVLILSYETFRIHAARFHARPDSCDLLICDEAHRCVCVRVFVCVCACVCGFVPCFLGCSCTSHARAALSVRRLKNDATLTNKALAGLHCRRRVLLSGTPMQASGQCATATPPPR
jgi:DNA repair and recombination RAD54-like protein